MTGFEAAIPYIIGGLAGAGIYSMASQKPPTPAPPPTMPLPNDQNALAARRRELAQLQAQRGRASTILTGESDKLGG